MKLHLGCWHRYFPGWVHVDLCDMKHIDYKRDIRDLSCFDDGVADGIIKNHTENLTTIRKIVFRIWTKKMVLLLV